MYEVQRLRAFAIALVAVGGVAQVGPANAQEGRPVDCELTVRGKTYIKGVCQFRPSGDGGFQISGGDYFVQVSVAGRGIGQASWNASPRSTHAQANLGEVTRKGACWSNAQTTICARDLPPGKAQAVIAAQPGGESLWPILPGLSACISARGKPEAGKALVLQNCRVPADHIFVRRGDGSLGIAKQPDLCLSLESTAPSRPPQLVVAACRPDLPRWTTQATSSKEDVVRSSDGRCLAIPQLSDPRNPDFPYFVSAAPCTGGAAISFLLSKG